MRRVFFAVLTLGPLMLSGCDSTSARKALPVPCQRFAHIPHAERGDAIRLLAPEDQLTVYVCSLRREPPSNYVEAIAQQGATVIPALRRRLVSGPEEDLHLLIRIPPAMVKSGTYDVLGDQPLMEELERAITRITATGQRLESAEILRKLKQH
jgi:hypothetical protein